MAQENSLKPIAQGDNMADFTPNEYTGIIWQYFKDYSDFTDEGIAALMGNMWAESGCTPYACQPSRPKNVCLTYIEEVDNNRITEYQFVHGGCSPTGGYTSTQLGFGLCQWTETSRKQGLHDKVFPNYPNMGGESIGNIYLQLSYVLDEIDSSGFSRVKSILTTSHSINDCSDIVLEVYENPQNQSQAVHQLRRTYSTQVYNTYASPSPTDLYIYLYIDGNGTATVSDTSPAQGDTITLTCIPASGESLLDIVATTLGGQSVALDPSLLSQTFTMPNESIIINVTFSGITPPTPTPTKMARQKMPIWMYPRFRT